jgi:hypothetical protein
MSRWANFIGYQLAWFAVVAAAGNGRPWLAAAPAAAFIAAQLALSRQRVLDLRLLGVAAGLGLVVDGALSASGWLLYAAPAPALPAGGAPLWILALWTSFSLTLTRSLAWLCGHPGWAMALAGLGGPLAYWSAARGFHAVRFVPPSYRAVTALAAGWALAISLLFLLIRRWNRPGAMPA